MTKKIFTLSNILSLSRIGLLIPILGVLFFTSWPHKRLYVIILILLGMLTDSLDGYFARKFNEVSELGKIIDPLADKICVAVVVVILAATGDIPFWYMWIVIGRDILIFLGGIYVKSRKGIVLASTMSGKVAVSFIALTLVFALLGNPTFAPAVTIFMWFSLASMAASVVVYGKRFVEVMRQ